MARSAFLHVSTTTAAVLCCIVVMAASSLVVEAAITCGTVAGSVASCIPYVQHQAGTKTAPAGCCNGLKSLDRAARTTPERQTTCGCLKTLIKNIPGADYGAANALLTQCGITDIPYKLSPSIDCTRIK